MLDQCAEQSDVSKMAKTVFHYDSITKELLYKITIDQC